MISGLGLSRVQLVMAFRWITLICPWKGLGRAKSVIMAVAQGKLGLGCLRPSAVHQYVAGAQRDVLEPVVVLQMVQSPPAVNHRAARATSRPLFGRDAAKFSPRGGEHHEGGSLDAILRRGCEPHFLAEELS